MENYRKIIGAIIVFFLSIFITQNVNASVNLDGYLLTDETYTIESSGSYQAYVNLNPSVWKSPLTWTTQDTYQKYIGVAAIRTNQTYDVKKGYIYKITASFFFRGGYVESSPGALLQTVNSNDHFKTVAIEPVQCEKIDGTDRYQNQTIYLNVGYSCIYDIYVQAKNTENTKFLIGQENTSVMFFLSPESQGIMTLAQDISIFERSPEASAEEKTEEQSEEGQNNADQADSDNEQATSSLLDIAGSIIGALTSSTTGTCTFDADLGNVDFGELNLCSGKPPEFANIIDIVIMLMLIPLIFMTVVSLVHQFINLTKFAQGGD